jgi:metal-sulfur cluster biosynthetic enzyme
MAPAVQRLQKRAAKTAELRLTCVYRLQMLKSGSPVQRSFGMSLPTEQEVRASLMEVNDPELGINIVDLGLIYGIDVSSAGISVRMTMTTPACPLHEYLSKASEDAIRRQFPDVNVVHIEFVWEPPWEPARMSPGARKQLGWQG